MKRNIITIAGLLGSGKSSTAKAVANSLKYKHFSSGDLFRQIATERGLSVEAMNLTAEVQQDIDYRVDELLQKMYANDDNMVIDSRMAWHWMPESCKVFLILDTDTASRRIFNHLKEGGRVSENAQSVAEVHASIERRFASEQKRYFDLYKVNPTDPQNFDMVLNTKNNNLETITAMVLACFDVWQK